MSQITRDRDSHPVPMDEWRISRLATFNSERARGIVHTDDWLALMAEEQEAWNRQQMAEMLAQGGEEVSPGVWIVPGKSSKRGLLGRLLGV